MTNENDRQRAKRRSPQELAEHYRQLAAQYDEKADRQARGEVSTGNSLLSRLKRAKRTRETALHHSQVTVNGKAPTEKSPRMNDIATKIENAEARLADLVDTQNRALERIAELPADIERLGLLVEACEKGEDVEFPSDLYTMPGEQTDAEAETKAAIGFENDPED